MRGCKNIGGTINQILSDEGKSFFNIESGLLHVGVWTSTFNREIVLYRAKSTQEICLMMFDDKQMREDWEKQTSDIWNIELELKTLNLQTSVLQNGLL